MFFHVTLGSRTAFSKPKYGIRMTAESATQEHSRRQMEFLGSTSPPYPYGRGISHVATVSGGRVARPQCLLERHAEDGRHLG